MAKYTTPGVYVEEISKFPPSVSEVPSAIPAFVGYTARAIAVAPNDLHLVPKKISSFADYQQYFGEPESETIEVAVSKSPGGTYNADSITPPKSAYLLYYSLKLYFDNGGGPCYIVSLGVPPVVYSKSDVLAGLDTLRQIDEVTLIVIAEAVKLNYSDYAQVAQAQIQQCSDLRDRFAILDVWCGDLKPDAQVEVSSNPSRRQAVVDANRAAWVGDLKYAAAYYPFLKTSYNYFVKQGQSDSNVLVLYGGSKQNLNFYQSSDPVLYSCVLNALKTQYLTLPPSGAVAGIYCSVDSTRGVWKAPANVALKNATAPAVAIDDRGQEGLNEDSSAGKSINVIRSFAGKGVLIWGSRTLAGNDNEWRYVPVRRFFIMVEESVKKSTQWVVFEPNDANTWVKVRAMIENYLTQKWKEGALQGVKSAEAFFVKCGLGTTMTAQDILEGRLIVEIGLAAVRPAEFIILRFSQKMQGS